MNPKGAGRKGVVFGYVYGDISPKETCTCRVRAHGGGSWDGACADVASLAGATVDGQIVRKITNQRCDGGQEDKEYMEANANRVPIGALRL